MKRVLRQLLPSFLTALLFLAVICGALAHESRPAYLEVTETAPGRYDVLWRTPVLSGMRLPVLLKLPDESSNILDPHTRTLSDSLVERRVVEVAGGLGGKRIEFPGLQATITDVLARVHTIDGGLTTTLVRPSQPWVEIRAAPSGALAIAGAFVWHGIEHILGGYDHLLFVLALILIVRSGRALFWTITAFTLAHSITLALATLGVVRVPGPPVEAAIAFSIVLLASEILRLRRGESSLTSRWPWVVAFAFGLLHGFGFAGALAEIGLPQRDIPLALAAFNIGVELGQLAFIGGVFAIVWLMRRVRIASWIESNGPRAAPYAIGALASFWFIERVASFWS
jgi:hydrogenase/urease accessory protein HupE